MDEAKKDISEQKSESLSIKVRLFDGKGQHAFIHQKSHKLASAIYLVTELIKDNEPLKWRMRERALLLISYNLSLASSLTDNKKSLLDSLSATCIEMVSLIEIGRTAEIISSMNFAILQKEFLDLLSFMETREQRHFGSRDSILTEAFFKTEGFAVPGSSEDVLYKGQNSVFDKMSFISNLSDTSPSEDASFKSRPAYQNTSVIKSKEHSHTLGTKPGLPVKDKKEDRREAILRVVRKMKEVTINDIVSVVSGCSEKTVQRELLTLVDEGILKKVGERRWSKYSIN